MQNFKSSTATVIELRFFMKKKKKKKKKIQCSSWLSHSAAVLCIQVNVRILQIRMWNIRMAKETRLGCLVQIVQ